jgi:hypothetical protein
MTMNSSNMRQLRKEENKAIYSHNDAGETRMHLNTDNIRQTLLVKMDRAICEIKATELVPFEIRGKRFCYAYSEGREFWKVPPEAREGLKKLLTLIRQFDRQIEDTKVDPLTARTFVSRYYRMQSEMLTEAEGLVCSTPQTDTSERMRMVKRMRLASEACRTATTGNNAKR